MTNSITEASQHKAAPIAGLMFLLAFIVPTLNWALVLSKLNVAENAMATAINIMSNKLLFRIGITVELFMAVSLLVLALSLYIILKPVNKNLALLALLLKLVEAAIVGAIVVVTFTALQVLDTQGKLTVLTPEQLQIPVGLMLNFNNSLFSIPMVFLGLDMMIFSYLFFKSRYIPRLLAGFGFASFALIFVHALMYMLAPNYAAMPIIQSIFYGPSGLFELVIGMWILIKGIDTQSGTVCAPESS